MWKLSTGLKRSVRILRLSFGYDTERRLEKPRFTSWPRHRCSLCPAAPAARSRNHCRCCCAGKSQPEAAESAVPEAEPFDHLPAWSAGCLTDGSAGKRGAELEQPDYVYFLKLHYILSKKKW